MKELTTEQGLESVLAESEAGPVFLYKHSTICPISGGALAQIREFLKSAAERCPPFHLVKVVESRAVSNAIAQRLGVQHHSPQLILVDGGRAVWDVSHHGITHEAIAEAVANHA